MTLDQLRYFVAAAKYEHINRGAQSIAISASVISNAVKELESEFKCELFVREKKRIRLTPTGTRFLELATLLLSQAEGMKEELSNADVSLSGHYRIGASNFLATKVITPVWTKLQNQYSSLTCEVSSQPTWVLVDNILSGRLDFGVGFSPSPHPQLELEEIFRGNSEIVVRKNHPVFERAKTQHYRLLREYPTTMHLASEKISVARPSPALKAVGLNTPITFGFDNDYIALENLRHSDNWSFMIDIIALEFSKYLQTVPFPKSSEAQYTVQIIRHKSRRVDAAMSEAFSLMKQQVMRLRKTV